MDDKIVKLSFIFSAVAMIASMLTLLLLFQQSVTGQLLLDWDVKELKEDSAAGSLIMESGDPEVGYLYEYDLTKLQARRLLQTGAWSVRDIVTSPLSDTASAINLDGRSAKDGQPFFTLTSGETFKPPVTIAENVLSAAWSADGELLRYTVSPDYAPLFETYVPSTSIDAPLPLNPRYDGDVFTLLSQPPEPAALAHPTRNQDTHFVWRKTTQQTYKPLPPLPAGSTYLWSPVSPILAGQTEDGLIVVLPTGDVLNRFEEAVSGLLGWSSDGKRLQYWVETAAGDEFWQLIVESGITQPIQVITDRRYEPLIPSTSGDEVAFTLAYTTNVTSTLGIINYVNGTYATIPLPEYVQVHADLAADMVWSPDDTRIAFVAATHDKSETTIEDPFDQAEIFVFDIVSGTMKQITTNEWYDGTVQWSPDSESVFFRSTWPRRWSYFVAPIVEEDYYMLTELNRRIEKAVWVEDVKRLPVTPTATFDPADTMIEPLPEMIPEAPVGTPEP